MKETDAIVLDNWFPRPNVVELRGGCVEHATGLGSAVETLAVHTSLTGASRMFGATATAVYEVTAAGAVGASVASRSDGKHQWFNFGDGSANYLIMLNGADKPLYFEGSTWVAVDAASTPALTGVATTSLISGFVSKGRIFFIEKNSLSVWYLSAGVAGGALTEFALDGVAQKGGYLMAGETWTFDGGDGLDDVVALVTSEGECLVYKGDNPSSSTAWALVGRYDVGRPLGRRCLLRYGGDVLVITEAGVFPLSALLQNTLGERPKLALSSKIENSFALSARQSGDAFGWEGAHLPAQQALVFNVPDSVTSRRVQYVMNTLTKAWCRFTGWNAETLAVLNGALYYGGDGVVYAAWVGASDNGDSIQARAKPAFSYFGSKGVNKTLKLYRPTLRTSGRLRYLTGVDYDYVDTSLRGQALSQQPVQDVWDTGEWGAALWAYGGEIGAEWGSPVGSAMVGHCFSVKIQVDSNSAGVEWISNDFVFEEGATL